MSVTIYHNPRCSKSRETLALVEQQCAQKGEPLDIVLYLQQPLDISALTTICHQLQQPAATMIRSKEDEFKQTGLDLTVANEHAILAAIADCPKLLERPIVVRNGRARIGRPPESVLELF